MAIIVEGGKRVRDKDLYITPKKDLENFLPIFLGIESREKILDAGCGTGHWGMFARENFSNSIIDGIDIQNISEFPYNNIFIENFITWETDRKYNLIIGNPPFSLKLDFVFKALTLLEKDGILMFLMPHSFLFSKKRYQSLFATHQPYKVFIYPKRISWTMDGGTDDTQFIITAFSNEQKSSTEMFFLNAY